MKRPPGRPPLDANDTSAQVSVVLPSRQLAALCEKANRERMTVPELIRAMLRYTPVQNKKT